MKKRTIGILLVSALFLIVLPIVYADISCSVKSLCGAGETDFGGMNNLTNAHFEHYNHTDYSNRICCGISGDTLSNSCSDPLARVFIRASNETNAHVELTNFSTTGYASACMVSDTRFLTLSFPVDNGSCTGSDTCMFTISNATNGHVATCNGTSYNISVCMTASSPVPEFSTLGMIAALSILSVGFLFSLMKRNK